MVSLEFSTISVLRLSSDFFSVVEVCDFFSLFSPQLAIDKAINERINIFHKFFFTKILKE